VTTDPDVCDEFEWDDLGTGCVRCRRLFEDHIAKIDTVNVDNKTLISLTELEPGFIEKVFDVISTAYDVTTDEEIMAIFRVIGNESLDKLDQTLDALGMYKEDE